MNEDCQRKYEFNSYSKEQILKVSALMSILFSNNYILGTVWTDPVGGEVQRLQNFPLPPPSPSDQWVSFYNLSVIKMLAVTESTVNTQHRAFRIIMS